MTSASTRWTLPTQRARQGGRMPTSGRGCRPAGDPIQVVRWPPITRWSSQEVKVDPPTSEVLKFSTFQQGRSPTVATWSVQGLGSTWQQPAWVERPRCLRSAADILVKVTANLWRNSIRATTLGLWLRPPWVRREDFSDELRLRLKQSAPLEKVKARIKNSYNFGLNFSAGSTASLEDVPLHEIHQSQQKAIITSL